MQSRAPQNGNHARPEMAINAHRIHSTTQRATKMMDEELK